MRISDEFDPLTKHLGTKYVLSLLKEGSVFVGFLPFPFINFPLKSEGVGFNRFEVIHYLRNAFLHTEPFRGSYFVYRLRRCIMEYLIIMRSSFSLKVSQCHFCDFSTSL